MESRRGVSPVIGVLMMTAIAVVGGTVLFTQSEAMMNTSQISGSPQLELISYEGYDARDTLSFVTHHGTPTQLYLAGFEDAVKTPGERIGIYIKNDSVNAVTIQEIRFGGIVYDYTQGIGVVDSIFTNNSPGPGQYALLKDAPNILTNKPSAEIEAGESLTIVISLDQQIPIGRDVQIRLTTSGGAIYSGTVVVGDFR